MRRTVTALLCALVLLLAFGVVLLYSASCVQGRNPNFYLERQAIWLVAGLALGCLAAYVDYRVWRNTAGLTVVAVLILLGLLAVFAFDKTNGSYRWVRFGQLGLQPSEFAKLGAIVFLAAWFDRIGPRVHSFWRGAAVPGLVLAVVVGLLLLEPDFGAALVTGVVGIAILLAAGTRWPYLIAGGFGGLAAFTALLWFDPVRRPRLYAFFDMLMGRETVAEEAHQLTQSIQAFMAGGPWGVGLNKSIQKYHYLPEAHTDFIFAIAGEEFGLVATLGVVLLFTAILVLGVMIALRAEDRFGRLMALGLTVLLIFAEGFNIGVVTGRLPTKGLALPFISYGGSSMIASLMAVGLLINIGLRVGSEERRPMRNALQRI
ncbi:MAG: putative peptidoglycan glycosyltransferase FtsW [Kiritimatiellae bacterium]|nr:putative peptidoglycan glycosyltransferase FtsW [Kiritimatiellia bacterium]